MTNKTKPICYGHCFLEFPDMPTFAEHCTKVAKQRERRKKIYQLNRLKQELSHDAK